MSEPIGDLLDSLGVKHDADEGELVAGAVVLLKVVTAEGDVAMRMAWSEGMSWIERVGMLRVGEVLESAEEAG